MNELSVEEYYKQSIKLGYPKDFNWIMDMYSFIAEDKYEDDYIKIEDKSLYVKIEDSDEPVLLIEEYTEPVITPKFKLKIKKDFLPNVKKDLETTAGRLLANYILISDAFNNKVEYINEAFNVSDIEKNYLAVKLVSEGDKDAKPDSIYVSEYNKFIDAVSYLTRINRFIVHAGSELSMTRETGIEEYRNKLIAEAKKKYKEDAMTRLDVVGEIDKKLEEHMKEHFKDDPTLTFKISGKSISGLKKMYSSYGHGGDMLYNDGKAHYVEKSLEEGWDKDKETIAVLYNDIRMASYKRGAETQKGGYTAKQGLRATTDLKIIKGDCGSKVGLEVHLTKDNKKLYLDRYVIENNKTTLLTEENIDKYVGKVIKVRSPLFCHIKNNFCSTCMGDGTKNYENGISIMVINMAGIILNTSMKAMHNHGVSLAKIDMKDFM